MGRNLTRRDFLKVGVGIVAATVGIEGSGVNCAGNELNTPKIIKYPDGIIRHGSFLQLPMDGREISFVSDLHGCEDEFSRTLRNSGIISKIKNGEAIGVIGGDLIDRRSHDPWSSKDGPRRLIDEIRNLQEGRNGHNLIYLMGNHEAGKVIRYDKDVKTDRERRDSSDNFYASMTQEDRDYLENLPLVAICRNGLVFSHAGPAQSFDSLDDLVIPNQRVASELYCFRPSKSSAFSRFVSLDVVKALGKLYDEKCFSINLNRVEGLWIYGHTDKKLCEKRLHIDSEDISDDVLILPRENEVFGNSAGFLPRHGISEKVRRYFRGNTGDLVRDSSYLVSGKTNLPVYNDGGNA